MIERTTTRLGHDVVGRAHTRLVPEPGRTGPRELEIIERPGVSPPRKTASQAPAFRPTPWMDGLIATASAAVVMGTYAAFGLVPVASVAAAPLLGIVWVVCMAVARAYEDRYLWAGSSEVHRVMAGAGASALPLLGLGWLWLPDRLAVSALLYLGLALTATLVVRWQVRAMAQEANRAGVVRVRVLAVGPAADVDAVEARVRRNTYHGWSVVAACTPERLSERTTSVIRLGGPADVVEAARRCSADVVLVCPGTSVDDIEDLRRTQRELEAEGRELAIAPPLVEAIGPRVSLATVCGLPIVRLGLPELRGPRRVVKSIADRTVGAVVLLGLLPVLLIVGVIVRATSPGPALFRQHRVGLDGHHFTMLKFRSMYTDAEERKEALASANEGAGPLFKMRKDPRITKVGGFLRRMSLDELPQILNIVRGDMSFVGPRPALPSEVQEYDDVAHRRLLVRPGLTGLWQIHGRSELPWAETRRLDVRYVENWSLGFDLSILARTAEAVLKGRGAY